MSDNKFRDELIATARHLATPGKGLLAADESTTTIGDRFKKINVENIENNRRAYRQLLFNTPGDWQNYISGVILYEETLFQKAEDGTPFVDTLKKRGVIPGIKVDLGFKPLLASGVKGDYYTQGLTDLGTRADKYYKQGARFAKWRAVYSITPDGAPSELAIQENARGLAAYASVCQQHGLVPIVEPEILMDGDHCLNKSYKVTHRVLAAVVKALHDFNIIFEGMILKPSMVHPGKDAKNKATAQQIAQATVTVLRNTIPAAVPAIMFLSGGLTEADATIYLQEMNKLDVVKPWSLSFSYGRALQDSTLSTWKGKAENVGEAQKAFFRRAKENYLAALPNQNNKGKL